MRRKYERSRKWYEVVSNAMSSSEQKAMFTVRYGAIMSTVAMACAGWANVPQSRGCAFCGKESGIESVSHVMMGCEAWREIRQKYLAQLLSTRVVIQLRQKIGRMLDIHRRFQVEIENMRDRAENRDREIDRLDKQKSAALRRVGGKNLVDAFLSSIQVGLDPLEDALTTVVFGGSYGGVRIRGWLKGKPSRPRSGSGAKQSQGDNFVLRAGAFALELLQTRWRTISSWRSNSGNSSSGQRSNE